MKNLKSESFQLDTSAPFNPTKLLSISRTNSISNDSEIKDLSEHLSPNNNDEDDHDHGLASDTIQEEATKQAASLPVLYNLKSTSHFTNSCVLTTESGAPLASLGPGIVTLGARKLTFPAGSEHSSHTIKLQPTSMWRGEQAFIKDSAVFFWGGPSRKHQELTKVVGEGRRVVVARYRARRSRATQGILAVDGEQVDVVVAVGTCLGVLTVLDSFTK